MMAMWKKPSYQPMIRDRYSVRNSICLSPILAHLPAGPGI